MTQKQIDYLRANAPNMTANELAKDMRKSVTTVRDWCKEIGVTPKAPVVQPRPDNHPWRYKNSALEVYHLARMDRRKAKANQ